MKNIHQSTKHRSAGFTMGELMVSMAIGVTALGMCMSTSLYCLRTMYKDVLRLDTNASLRRFTQQLTKETIDSSEYYIFPLYTKLDGNVSLSTAPIDTSGWVSDSYGTSLAYGDCLVLVTRVDDSLGNSAIRQFRIYYRAVTDSNNDGEVRYWESQDYGLSSTQTNLTTLLNGVDLKTTPKYPGSKLLTSIARGRKKSTWTISNQVYNPIFSTESPTTSASNQNVSVNVEFINKGNNTLSSSSFNYTISPRK